MPACTMRSTLRSGLPLRLVRSCVRHSNASVRAGSPLPVCSITNRPYRTVCCTVHGVFTPADPPRLGQLHGKPLLEARPDALRRDDYWAVAAATALTLVARGRIVPGV